MMNCAYDELYLPLAQRVMGDMLDYAVNTVSLELEVFFSMFLTGGMAHQFENGNPTYIVGKNGCEVAREVIETCSDLRIDTEDVMYLDKSPEYWIGWSLSYYQWYSSLPYAAIDRHVPIGSIYGLYPTLHEADLSLYVDVMNERCLSDRESSMLKRLRAYAGLSQRALAERSGVALRQIQLFEQGQRDIGRAQGRTLLQLSRALHCDVEMLIGE